VGIGATPSAWNSSIKAIDISTATALAELSGQSFITNNLYYNSGGNWIYKTTAAAGILQQTAGSTTFYRTISGTAGTTATPIVTANIDSSSNFQFNSGYGSVATAYGCRAWVNFNSVGTVSIYSSGNCSSITDNGVGNFTFNFATAMPDTNYSAVTGPTQSNSNSNGGLMMVFLSATNTYSAPTVNSFRFINVHAINSALGDSVYNSLAVFR
jgi:hypothetical protein